MLSLVQRSRARWSRPKKVLPELLESAYAEAMIKPAALFCLSVSFFSFVSAADPASPVELIKLRASYEAEIIRVTEDGYRFVPPKDFVFVYSV